MIKNIINNRKYEIIIKDNYIHLINYVNIIDICSNRIKILLNNSTVVINGSCLMISALDEFDMIIKGNIKGIEFINE